MTENNLLPFNPRIKSAKQFFASFSIEELRQLARYAEELARQKELLVDKSSKETNISFFKK